MIQQLPVYPGKSMMANRLAKTSVFLSSAALLCMMITDLLFWALPISILAVIYANQAIRQGTEKERLAGMGKNIGLLVLAGFATECGIALLLIAVWRNWF